MVQIRSVGMIVFEPCVIVLMTVRLAGWIQRSVPVLVVFVVNVGVFVLHRIMNMAMSMPRL